MDGNECPVFCPLTVSNCPENHMICPGGLDANSGCPIPATCMPMTGREFLKSTFGNTFQMIIFKTVYSVYMYLIKIVNISIQKKVQLAMMDLSVQPHVQRFARLTICLVSLDLTTMAVRCLKLVYPSMVILILWKSSSIKVSKLHTVFP